MLFERVAAASCKKACVIQRVNHVAPCTNSRHMTTSTDQIWCPAGKRMSPPWAGSACGLGGGLTLRPNSLAR